MRSTFPSLATLQRNPYRIGISIFFFIIVLLTQTPKGLPRPRTFNVSIEHDQDDTSVKDASYEKVATDWSRFAYTQYATSSKYLCNSVMIFETLQRLGSRADRLLMYPSTMKLSHEDGEPTEENILLRKARDDYRVKLQPVEVQRKSVTDFTWAESYTKLLAFNQTQYKRVLTLDSDSTLLQSMDELFLLPPVPLALPRAYWLKSTLTSALMLIQPSTREFDRIQRGIASATAGEFDMEIVNELYSESALTLPHRPYCLLSGELRKNSSSDHSGYLGDDETRWDVEMVLEEAKYLHFSDWPVPKPWATPGLSVLGKHAPLCEFNAQLNSTDCRARNLWLGFYEDFAKRQKTICGQGELAS